MRQSDDSNQGIAQLQSVQERMGVNEGHGPLRDAGTSQAVCAPDS
jgi:hypothetical protein